MKFSDRDVLIDPCNNLDRRAKDLQFSSHQIRAGLTLTLLGLLVLIVG
jgi:hypothetical protein